MRPSTLRHVAVFCFLLAGTAGALVQGCATSEADSIDDDDSMSADASKDGSKNASDAKSDTLLPGKDATAEPEEGQDADVDPDTDAATDAGTDAGKDSGTDSGTDAGKDSGTDSGVDAGTDAGADAGDSGSGGPSVLPLQGEVVISEVMFDPSTADDSTEWFEVYNATSQTKLLSGLSIEDANSRKATIGGKIEIQPGAYLVFVNNLTGATGTAKVPAGVIAYDYGAGTTQNTIIQLSNSNTGSVVLKNGTTEIARAKYGPLGLTSGNSNQSVQLKELTYTAAGDKTKWCQSPNKWPGGADKGTPGAASDCP